MIKFRYTHKIMGAMTQNELEKPYFHCDIIWEKKYKKKVKCFKVTNMKNKQNK